MISTRICTRISSKQATSIPTAAPFRPLSTCRTSGPITAKCRICTLPDTKLPRTPFRKSPKKPPVPVHSFIRVMNRCSHLFITFFFSFHFISFLPPHCAHSSLHTAPDGCRIGLIHSLRSSTIITCLLLLPPPLLCQQTQFRRTVRRQEMGQRSSWTARYPGRLRRRPSRRCPRSQSSVPLGNISL